MIALVRRLAPIIAMGTAACWTMPAAAAFVAPVSGTLNDRISISADTRSTIPLKSDGDEDAWVSVPAALSTSVAVNEFPSSGGLLAGSQRVNATWTSADAGTIDINFQGLITSTDPDYIISAFQQTFAPDSPRLWTYRFVATTDSLLTFNIDLTSDMPTGGGLTSNVGSLSINNSFRNLASDSEPSVRITYNLLAGAEYILQYSSSINFTGVSSGSSVFNASQRASFAITDRPIVTPPIPSVPEPATWAMMVCGFAAVGAGMRWRPRAGVGAR